MNCLLDTMLEICAGRGPVQRLHRRLFEEDYQRYMANARATAPQAQSEIVHHKEYESKANERKRENRSAIHSNSTQQLHGNAHIAKRLALKHSRNSSHQPILSHSQLPEHCHSPKFPSAERKIIPAHELFVKGCTLEFDTKADRTTFPAPSSSPDAGSTVNPTPAKITSCSAPKSSSEQPCWKPSLLYELPPLPRMVGIGRYRRSATATNEWLDARRKEIDIREPWLIPDPDYYPSKQRTDDDLPMPAKPEDAASVDTLVGSVKCTGELASNTSSTTTAASFEAARAWSWNHSWRDGLLDKDTTSPHVQFSRASDDDGEPCDSLPKPLTMGELMSSTVIFDKHENERSTAFFKKAGLVRPPVIATKPEISLTEDDALVSSEHNRAHKTALDRPEISAGRKVLVGGTTNSKSKMESRRKRTSSKSKPKERTKSQEKTISTQEKARVQVKRDVTENPPKPKRIMLGGFLVTPPTEEGSWSSY